MEKLVLRINELNSLIVLDKRLEGELHEKEQTYEKVKGEIQHLNKEFNFDFKVKKQEIGQFSKKKIEKFEKFVAIYCA